MKLIVKLKGFFDEKLIETFHFDLKIFDKEKKYGIICKSLREIKDVFEGNKIYIFSKFTYNLVN